MMHPKQFLALVGSESMLRTTRDRVRTLIDDDHTWVVTGQDYVDKVRENLPSIPTGQILGEPVGRNTAPSIAWAASSIAAVDPDGVMVVLPSDHMIRHTEKFRLLVGEAMEQAEAHGGFYTFGIVPNHPETGYGYIEQDGEGSNPRVQRVARFVEKPPLEQAEAMVQSGRYYWNSGMFVFPIPEFLAAVDTYLPTLSQGLHVIGKEPESLDQIFPELPQVSVDHGILEKVASMYVLRADIGWDDVGTFAALARLLPRNGEMNAARGHAVFVDSENVTAISEGPVVSCIGVKDLVVVATQDAVLILSPDRAQDVRQVVQALKEGRHEHLL